MVYRYKIRDDNTVEGAYVDDDGAEISIIESQRKGASEGHVNPAYQSESNIAEAAAAAPIVEKRGSQPTSEVSERRDSQANSEVSDRSESQPSSEVSDRRESQPTSEVSDRRESQPSSEVSDRRESHSTSEVSYGRVSQPTSEVSDRRESQPTSIISDRSDSRRTSELADRRASQPTKVTRFQDQEEPAKTIDSTAKNGEARGGSNTRGGSKANSKAFRENSKRRKSLDDPERAWLSWVQSVFEKFADHDNVLDKDRFAKAITRMAPSQSFFAERFFTLFDTDNSGTIELLELMDGLRTMTKGSPKEKLKFLFDVYDMDGNGTIDRDELKVVLQSCMEESAMQLSDEDLEDLTDALFDEADEDGSGAITFDELVGELDKFPGVMENLTMSASNWLKPPAPKGDKKNEKYRYFSKRYIMNNPRKLIFMLIFFLINIGLSAISIWRYWDSNAAVIIARICGMCLNFNSAFIIVLMLRRLLTWLRSTRAAHILPLDQSIMLHKMVGIVIFIQSMVHTIAHVVNIALVKDQLKQLNVTAMRQNNETVPVLYDLSYWRWLLTLDSGIGYVGPGFAYVSGVVLDIILVIMVVCSMSFVRKNGYFQLFYWTHLLYVAFLILLILHGPIFWMFFIVPGTIFVGEKLIRSKLFKLSMYGHMYITEVNLLPSKVTHIVIARPDKFYYKPGDYVFINIPAIAGQEWHPFTISSAPERDGRTSDVVWLHVRSAGHWTNKLYDFFDACPTVDPDLSWKKRRMSSVTDHKFLKHRDIEKGLVPNGKSAPKDGVMKGPRKPKGRERQKFVSVEIFVDGPYGTSTREIFETEHAVLIASGIGVTPYASILQSIARRYAAMRHKCPNCEHAWTEIETYQRFMKLRKVDFIWINRDQKCFEWFVSLLAQLELEGNQDESFDKFLEMQMYMTAARGKNDMIGLGLQIAMEILYKKDHRDVLTGLKTRTQPGRPKWHEVFSKIRQEDKGKVKIFFCGSPGLAKEIKVHAESFGFQFSKENF